MITQDKKTLLLDNYAKWRIVDPLKVYQNFQSQRGALQRLHDIIYSELRVELQATTSWSSSPPDAMTSKIDATIE
ncbi:MAG: hypothetical protein IPK92_15935 [Nitrospira sp.]|nr:hypothetical protein [Nitrospira sp.]